MNFWSLLLWPLKHAFKYLPNVLYSDNMHVHVETSGILLFSITKSLQGNSATK